MKYATREKSRGRTTERMTVGDLKKELNRFPDDALVVLSGDEEGNTMKLVSEITFDKNCTMDLAGFIELEEPAITIWPNF